MNSITRDHTLPELWGGIECTINRVGGAYFDQIERSGHSQRLEDLGLFAELGIRALRYPVLWERTAPSGLDRADWSWGDQRLKRLRALGIRPILGLLHHGSGPRETSLTSPDFAEGLARFASAVAQRYPWVDCYTPINEPLTTARFSGLYGYWYPHGQDGLIFARALINQCRATVLAVRELRRVNPAVQLLQTEDLGKTFSTPPLAYQADFENQRRWLGFDLLCGRVDREHPLWDYLSWVGIAESELAWFVEHPCPPDLMGMNYYITSERFLDHECEQYPAPLRGGNGRHAYADVESVRARPDGLVGPRQLLAEAWERYRLPLAITEMHLACTREEQLRWVDEIWHAARGLRCEGIDLRAVTAWSLLGAFDWNSLLTRNDGYYEPGVFDIRGPRPRRTALVPLLQELAQGRTPQHPVLATPGWWRRPERLLFGASRSADTTTGAALPTWRRAILPRPLLITGASGTLGRAFARLCDQRGLRYRLLTRQQMDIADQAAVSRTVEELNPWAVVNAAGYVRVDEAERESARCLRENTDGPSILAAACAQRNVQLLTFSSDLVFDGRRRQPYLEGDTVGPLGVYGHSKAKAERRVLELLPTALVVRTSAFFGAWDHHNFVAVVLKSLRAGLRFIAAEDVMVSPTYVPDLVHACLDLIIDRESGVWHLANCGAITWADLARRAADFAHGHANNIEGRPLATLGWPAPRPAYSVLSSERGSLLPSLDDALSRHFGDPHLQTLICS